MVKIFHKKSRKIFKKKTKNIPQKSKEIYKMKPAPPEYYRLKTGPFGSPSSYGNAGVFVFAHYRIAGYQIHCMITDGAEATPAFEHVSVTVGKPKQAATRCPTWEEMCWVKDQFWEKDECVIQFHPPQSHYISDHDFCLHLWKPVGITLPLPDPIMVGRPSFIKTKPS